MALVNHSASRQSLRVAAALLVAITVLHILGPWKLSFWKGGLEESEADYRVSPVDHLEQNQGDEVIDVSADSPTQQEASAFLDDTPQIHTEDDANSENEKGSDEVLDLTVEQIEEKLREDEGWRPPAPLYVALCQSTGPNGNTNSSSA